MEQNQLKQALLLYGMAYDVALRRFSGNESMLLTFVREFPAEPYMTDILDARRQGDETACKACVHTLKGASGTLGFTRLYEPCCRLMDALRGGEGADVTEPLFQAVKREYDYICTVIQG